MLIATARAFVANTGIPEAETLEAALRFSATIRSLCTSTQAEDEAVACSTLAMAAFMGDVAAWRELAALVAAVLEAGRAVPGRPAMQARRELRAFLAENADLLE